MNAMFPFKRLFRIAIYTSSAIGLITMGPVYIIGITLGGMNITSAILLKLLGITVTGISLFVFIIWLINILLLYYYNKRTILFKKKNSRYVLSFLLCFLLMLSIRLFTNPFLNDPQKIQQILDWKIKVFGIQPGSFNYMQFNNLGLQILIMVFVIISIDTVVLIIQELVILNEKKTKIESENIRLKIKNIEAANQKLKQQLQPHFLFNSLNVLKSLIRKKPVDAEVYLKKLSDFLRASLSFDNVNTVKFEEELKLSLDYIEMQKIRFGEAIHFEADIPEDAKGGLLPIFSVQLLLENAIKHNAFTIESPLYIKLFYINGWITVSNHIHKKTTQGPSTGMGLTNLSERYKIISGDDILIQSDDSDFSVSIKILPDENCNH